MKWILVLLLSLSAAAQTVSLEELRQGGQPQLLMTWCPHCACCRQGERILLRLQREYPGVRMRALDAHGQDNPISVRAALQKRNLKLPVVFDVRGRLCRFLGVRSTTTIMLWDRQGQLVFLGNLASAERAVRQLSAGEPVLPRTTPQSGCPIVFLTPP